MAGRLPLVVPWSRAQQALGLEWQLVRMKRLEGPRRALVPLLERRELLELMPWVTLLESARTCPVRLIS